MKINIYDRTNIKKENVKMMIKRIFKEHFITTKRESENSFLIKGKIKRFSIDIKIK